MMLCFKQGLILESPVGNYTRSKQASSVMVTQGEEMEYEMGGAWGHPAARYGLGVTAASGGENKTTSREQSL